MKEKMKEKKTKETKPSHYKRLHSVADAIMELRTFTDEQLAKRADTLFSKNGGKANPKESKDDVRRALSLLSRMGLLGEKEGKFTFKK